MCHNKPRNSTPVLALLCAACLLPLLPAVAHAQPTTRTDYWINDTDSALAETVVDDTIEPVPPDSGDWSEITLDDIHDLGRTSPSEDEEWAASNGYYWQRGSSELGSQTIESAWFVPWEGQGQRRISSGSGSTRIWWKICPGYVAARTDLFKGTQWIGYASGAIDPWWTIKVSTKPEKWNLPSPRFHWVNNTVHSYSYQGVPIYGPNPEIDW
jgi:hypothetical protein